MALDWLRKSASPPPGRGTGIDGGIRASVVNTDRPNGSGGGNGKRPPVDGELLVKRRHIDFIEHQLRWRWLLDSFEAGDRYRQAAYGPDRRGLPNRNMFRHKREYPDPQTYPAAYQDFAGYAGAASMMADTDTISMYGPFPGMIGADPGATAQDDDYEYRRARTPVPEFVAEAVEIHLAKVYDQEVYRDGPADLKLWWKDVDGRGTPIDDWMRETLAPLLLVLGCIDVILDHPKAPPGEKVATRADELRLGLDRCVASYILPENMVWWRNDPAGRYVECLVREYVDPSDRVDLDEKGRPIDPNDGGNAGATWRRNYLRYRYWTAEESVLYSYGGDEILERKPHPFGCVPIIRLVDLPRHRTPHIGKSRYEAIAEYQREYYNRDSELILSDTLQAHPFLSGAEDFCKSDNTLSIGPGYVLPMKKNPESGSYQGWEFVSPPKDPAESLRKNKDDIVAMKDRRACLAPPAGAQSRGSGGTGHATVSQSGVSKQIDQTTGHKLLGDIAKTAAKAERGIAEFALMVARNGPIDRGEREKIDVVYPAKFELAAAAEMLADTVQYQIVLGAVGNTPEAEALMLKEVIRKQLVGLDDATYRRLDEEIDLFVASKAQIKEAKQTMDEIGIRAQTDALGGEGDGERGSEQDPTGVSAVTGVTGGFVGGV